MRMRIRMIMAAVAALMCGCATLGLQEPEIQGVHPRITGMDFNGVTMLFDLDVSNSNVFAIRAPRIRYALDVEGSKLLDAETTSSINLPKNEVGRVGFPVRVSYADLLKAYRTLANAQEAHYDLVGALVFPVAGVRTLELPFSHQGSFPILRPPSFSDVGVKVAEMSPAGAKININALARNPNIFPLGIENMGYVLKLGDLRIADLKAAGGSTLEAGETTPLSFSAEVSGAGALLELARGSNIGRAQLLPSGSVQTPYGSVMLP